MSYPLEMEFRGEKRTVDKVKEQTQFYKEMAKKFSIDVSDVAYEIGYFGDLK